MDNISKLCPYMLTHCNVISFSELNAGTCHSSPDGVMANKAKDYFHSRSKHSSRTHSHKHSRHHR